MNKSRIPFYEEKLRRYKLSLSKIKHKHATVSILRLLAFLGLALSWFYIITLNTQIGVLLGSLLLVLFFFLLKWHKRIEDQKKFIESLLEININELDCCNSNFTAFNAGYEFVDHHHAYSFDIDLFGQGSLFQYLNRTVTSSGKNLLANWLANTPLSNPEILSNQQAVAELSALTEFRQKFQTTGSLYPTTHDDEDQIKMWLKQPTFFGRKTLMKIAMWGLPIMVALIVLLIAAGMAPVKYLAYIFLFNLVIIGFSLKRVNIYYAIFTRSHTNLKKMAVVLKLIEGQNWDSSPLKKFKSKIFKNQQPASMQVNKLTKLLDAFDNRNNILLGVILNGFIFWDWNCIWRIETWQKRHLIEIEGWMEVIARFDALNSLANLSFNNPDFTFPDVSHNEFVFIAEELGHPLLESSVRICNNFSIDSEQRFAIVTGANMAGKSTFLRTVAVNLVLAGCGAPVCAKKISFTPLPLFSSMRAEDSLMNHESYFFAELKRLQCITRELEKGEKLFIILDEILRGTNSEDKRKGSIGFVKKITERMAHGLVATHDLELARLAEQQPDVFKALCFEVEIKDNDLKFDYRLQSGVTQNMNASFLMQQMGIIDA